MTYTHTIPTTFDAIYNNARFLSECAGVVRDHCEDGDETAIAGELRTIRAVVAELEAGAVAVFRQHGTSWADIGAAFGITRQAAQKRWDR